MAKVHLPTDPAELLALPPPILRAVKRTSASSLESKALHFFERWTWLLHNADSVATQRLDWTCPKCGRIKAFSGAELWARLILVTGTYYENACRNLARACKGLHRPIGPPGLNIRSMKSVSGLPAGNYADVQAEARMIHIEYQLATIATFMIGPLKRMPVNSPIYEFERIAHDSVQNLSRWRTKARNRDLRQLAAVLSNGLLELLTATYSELPRTWNKDHRSGPFSAIRLPEFASLAHREPAAIALYGAKHVESIFEQQLALILQSFGFIVVQTRRGERTVDLVCISPDAACPMTFLVEAKTTKGEYNLPTSDQRALLEYVRKVQANLTTLPVLAFVLLVTPPVATTVERKLSSLQAEASLPIRLMTATRLAELREAIPGPIRVPIFRTAVLESPTRVLPSIAKIVVEDRKRITFAHESLIRAYIPAMWDRTADGDPWGHGHTAREP